MFQIGKYVVYQLENTNMQAITESANAEMQAI